jgi:nucleoside-diphosphate-sugar epimerase
VGEALGIEPDLRFAPVRVGEVTHYVANIGKAFALLGYQPQTSLKAGIRKAVAWGAGIDPKSSPRQTGQPG